MSIKKNITIDGMEVPFKASAAVPRPVSYTHLTLPTILRV